MTMDDIPKQSTETQIPSPSFYKLMLFPTTLSHKLRIPEDFATAFGDELCGAMTLTVLSGESKVVELLREDATLWFCDGWKEFVEFFNIGDAYFLIFTYEGKSHFRVNIFDPSGCEVTHPCSCEVKNENNLNKLSSEHSSKEEIDDSGGDNVNVEFLSTSFPDPKNFDVEVIHLDSGDDDDHIDQVSPGGSYRKHIDDDGDGNVDFEVVSTSAPDPKNLDEDFVLLDSDSDHGFFGDKKNLNSYNIRKHNSKANHSIQGTPCVPVWLRNNEKLVEAVVAAGMLLPDNPFFVAQIRKYNMVQGHYLRVPATFARKHIKRKIAKHTASLETSDGSRAQVRYLETSIGGQLGAGWTSFARKSGLKVGDACVFELTDAKHIEFKVHVAKKSQIRAFLS